MTTRALLLIWCLAPLVSVYAQAPGDAGRGARYFHPCTHCHSTAPGEQGVGPSLAKVFGARAGTVEGFTRYSEALAKSGKVWDAATLDAWLADPVKLIPGNTMAFPGVRNAQARADLIAYLKAVADGTAPARAERQAPQKIDLRKAPPEGQVRSITLCKDTYTVETADGKREEVAESSLQFRTDASNLGPAPGKPVALGAARNAEGGTIVFASPAEISRFVRSSCKK
jgi:cytochrome c